jgi:hypothetical protein
VSSQGPEPTEEQMRAALEEEMKRVKVQDIVVQTVVSLINLGARRVGLGGGDPEEQDLEQGRVAIEAVRGLLPLVETELGPDAKQIRDALSQVQLAYVRAGGTAPAGAAPGGAGPGEGADAGSAGSGAEEPAPSAQSSGRLWVPGQ